MSNIQKTVLLVVIFSLGIFVGQNVSLPLSKSVPVVGEVLNTQTSRPDLSLFWKVWDLMNEKYFDKAKIDPKKMIDGAIAGMVSAIGDPYTVYLTPEQNENFNENISGKYSGVGIQLGYQDQRMVVIAPLDETPAQRAGVKPNDQILKIGDKNAAEITLPEAVTLIRGNAGTSIKLTLLSDGSEEPYEINLVREEIIVKTVSLKSLPENTAYVKITQFGDNTRSEWAKIVDEIKNAGYNKVILDLRNNPGGRFDTAIRIVSEFVGSGLAAKQEWYDGRKQDYPVLPGGRLTKTPLIVLVNKGSASASEIFAGSMKDNNRAKVIGEKTFGKGTVQEVEEFDNKGGVHITSSRWLTPNGTWINDNKGLTPDIEITLPAPKEGEGIISDLTKDLYIIKALEVF
ncbi:MAG: hypothetical protein A3F33_02480 [Candidatus Woykebacteria bacterium RIFCSPHIGHO2_12_FULL_43_10]|uniref:PDZ domain-containing protein n=2 Tax=Candidatus Woykeibacteriota TaxID=1817899 RepID=A0A1G1WWS6_9BACT|nr:MAG: hypothetical protein A2802_00080 [Candidatus Woykebacteria bacterium RIFCSPHIGHO2_01_FULL_43_29]OGY28631.1 MAG: hypothetical protein A3F33_02480 [Candidatus Woykebacteria bacterium RIFCSPHIGHO2_12_FULL_43_10]OGY29981.1 MAG: hypothetical protein A3J50_02770 [Candidatus Woykebacteria bacterium RIFCSPHIGHO2_02_FULL_43_16b]OGY32031.1 MAG: hypothetical protein A3A61_01270 [Candidatus Woykebacteria bacterium RIFCSPLOWO2_01_FULL_43_14]